MNKQLLLASSSASRAEVLSKTTVPFLTISPDIDETYCGSNPAVFVSRLAEEKAKKGWELLLSQNPKSLEQDFYVIGADQVATMEGKIFGKPESAEEAELFLSEFSGKTIEYYSGLSVFSPKANSMNSLHSVTKILFRDLSKDQIKQYISLDLPLNCAGALKVESLGSSLLESYQSDDISAITGLPLLALNKLLKKHQLCLLDFKK